MADSSSFEALNPYQMCDKAAAVMEGKALKPARKAFLLAIMAGVFTHSRTAASSLKQTMAWAASTRWNGFRLWIR